MIIENTLSIEEIAYEKYVLNWLQENVGREIFEDTYSNYQNYILVDNNIISFDEYIEKYGYCGKLYSDYDSFLNNEYKNKEFMQKILSSEEIIVYENDLKMKGIVEKLDIDLMEER